MDIQRKLPHSVEAEQGVLGSMLISPRDCIAQAVEKIGAKYFHIPAHQVIYNALVDIWGAGGGIDLITFTEALRNRHTLDSVGGASFVTSLFTFVPSSSNIGYYLDIMRDKYILREIISTCTEGARLAYEEQEGVDTLLSLVQSKLLAVTSGEFKEEKTIADFANAALEELVRASETKGAMVGLSTGLPDLDKKSGGLRPGQLIVIGGGTGGGKTALALNIAEHNAIHASIPVGIISLEMTGDELSERLISSLSRVDLHRFVMTGGGIGEAEKISSAVTRIADSKVFICDEADIDFSKMRAIGREMKRKHKIELLIVDYIQLLISTATKEENRERAMANASAALKQMAKELGIPVIALCQLNDDGKLRESRAIGHNADKVMVITIDEDEAFVDLNKNRRGPKGAVRVTWLPHYVKFVSYAEGPSDPKLFGYGR